MNNSVFRGLLCALMFGFCLGTSSMNASSGNPSEIISISYQNSSIQLLESNPVLLQKILNALNCTEDELREAIINGSIVIEIIDTSTVYLTIDKEFWEKYVALEGGGGIIILEDIL